MHDVSVFILSPANDGHDYHKKRVIKNFILVQIYEKTWFSQTWFSPPPKSFSPNILQNQSRNLETYQNLLSVNIEYTTMRHVRVIALSFDDDHGATVAVDNYDIC